MSNETQTPGGAADSKTAIIVYPEHPYAASFPMMAAGDDYEAFKRDMREFGQKEPVVLFEGKVLDGRNRQKGQAENGIQPIFREFDAEKEGHPLDFVMALNLHRRHLSQGQRAAIATDFEQIFAEEAKARRERGAASGPGYDEEEETPTPDEPNGDANGAGTSGASESSVDTGGEFNQGAPSDDTLKMNGASGANGAKPKPAAKKAAPAAKETGEAALSRTKAAKLLGVSARSVSEAKKLKASDPKAFEQVKAGTKSLNAAASGAGSAGSKAAEEYDAALKRIEEVCGKPLAKAIREGARLKKRGDVLAYAKLDDKQMMDIRHHVELGWPLSKAIHYKAETILPTHRIIDAINRATAEGKGGFKQTILTPEIGCDWELSLKPVTRPKVEDVIANAKVGEVIADPNAGVKKAKPAAKATRKPAADKKAPAKKKVAHAAKEKAPAKASRRGTSSRGMIKG